MLKNRQFHNLKFKRQYPIGNYIVDFVCVQAMIVIEIDGGQHNTSRGIEEDKKRTEYIESCGYNVIRFWNSEIYENIEGVLKTIEAHIPHQEH